MEPTIQVDCIENNNWRDADKFIEDFNELLLDPFLTDQDLFDKLAELIEEHIKRFTQLSVPRNTYRSGQDELILVSPLIEGGNGRIYKAMLKPSDGKRVNGLVKTSLDPAKEKEIATETFMQSLLYCVASQAYANKGVKSPIPKIITPLTLVPTDRSEFLTSTDDEDDDSREQHGAMMENGGTSVLDAFDTLSSTDLCIVTLLLAMHLQTLQDLVEFRHNDLHMGNVLFERSRYPKPVELSWSNRGTRHTATLKANMAVSIIDFGWCCLDYEERRIRAYPHTPGEENMFENSCEAQYNAGDLAMFLLTMANDFNNEQQYNEDDFPGTSFLQTVVYPLVDMEIANFFRETGAPRPPGLSAATLGTEAQPAVMADRQRLYFLSQTARVCTPDNVMHSCLAYLQRVRR